jgi:uncharacterized membrane protein YeaQ/YmgE (transglycosylase-associated protein family)
MDLASQGFLVTFIIGGLVGWLASIMMKTNAQMGILANVIIGVAGSFRDSWVCTPARLRGRGSSPSSAQHCSSRS